jgi:hypothetical protein
MTENSWNLNWDIPDTPAARKRPLLSAANHTLALASLKSRITICCSMEFVGHHNDYRVQGKFHACDIYHDQDGEKGIASLAGTG